MLKLEKWTVKMPKTFSVNYPYMMLFSTIFKSNIIWFKFWGFKIFYEISGFILVGISNWTEKQSELSVAKLPFNAFFDRSSFIYAWVKFILWSLSSDNKGSTFYEKLLF